jgi:uncharacterized glyoxalase superfamily protein PhnB
MRENRSMPASTVIPVLGYPDVGAAIDWLCSTFGFSLRLRIANHRAQLNVGDGAIVVTEQSGPVSKDSQSVMVRVENVDSHHDHTVQHGARVLDPPADYPFGERQYVVEDFAGHRWTFSQSVADVDPKDWGGTPG